jgi:hypothetical protein
MRGWFLIAVLMTAILPTGCASRPARIRRESRNYFLGLADFSKFTKSAGANSAETVLISPEISVPIPWDELVVSWNVPPGVFLKLEARGVYPDRDTAYYTLGLWSDDISRHPRQSVNGQSDADGAVKTDTLMLNRRGAKVQLRITLGCGETKVSPQLKFLGLSFHNRDAPAAPREPNRAAWGKTVSVPELRQGEYEGGFAWCSPTSVAMVMDFWSETLHRPDLKRGVPEIAAGVNDPSWDGTGNWPFNTAYAGSFPGMRAYVTRFDDLSEVEDCIAAGIPVILSVSSYLTLDRDSGPDNGHLVVCAGFTREGDLVVNDPGVSIKRNQSARRIYPRAKVLAAWKKSANAVYLIFPESLIVPRGRDNKTQ